MGGQVEEEALVMNAESPSDSNEAMVVIKNLRKASPYAYLF